MGHTKICDILLNAKSNPNQLNSDQQSPLHRAAVNNKQTVRKENKFFTDTLGQYSIYIQFQIIDFLISANADPNITDKNGNSYNALLPK